MLIHLLLGLPVMAVCLLLQSLLFAAALRYYLHHKTKAGRPSFGSTLLRINGVMMLLIVGNVAQITIWAVLFRLLGEFADFGEAVYHSAVNFATLGYGDIVMSDRHKILGPLEALNGVIMIGLSTASLMAAFQDTMVKNARGREQTRSAGGAADPSLV
jgi:hypothetical protein